MSLRVSRAERRVFRGAAKELFCKAQQVLGRPGVLTRMLLSFLLVLAAGGVFLLFSALFGAFFGALPGISPGAQKILSYLSNGIFLALCFFLLLPLFWGRMRMAAQCLLGELPPVTSVFYAFTSGRRYLRALQASACALLFLGVPVGVTAALLFVPPRVFAALSASMSMGVSVAITVFSWVLVVLIGLTLLLLSFLLLPFLPWLFAYERRPIRLLFADYLKRVSPLSVGIFYHAEGLLWRVLLSLLGIGVPGLLYFFHLNLLSFLCLSLALTPKEDLT